MNGRLSIAAVAALIAFGGTAEARVLTAGPAFTNGSSNGKVICWLFNTGSSTATVAARQVFFTDGDSSNGQLTVSSDGCRNPLGVNRGCQFSASTGPFVNAYTCLAVVTGVEEDVSGAMQVMSSTGEVLLTVPLK
jgi:hypothetical protein